MALQPGDEFAGYRIISLLGRGGMGQVYLVENPHLRRREALKVISAAGAHDSDFQRRFTQEAQTAAALSHPAIVTIYHYGVEDETPWFTMEHLDGANPTHQSLTTEEVVEVAGHVAAALDYAHRRHVVHRDIKPANIVVLRDDDGAIERAVVLDFGIAKLLDATGLTASSAFIGTLAYTAPEIIDGHPASPASDQYALGCTIYELFCGTMPFTDSTPSALMMAHISRAVRPLSEQEPRLAEFDDPLARALSKNPHQRFANCRQFVTTLSHGCAEQAAQASVNLPIYAGTPIDNTSIRGSDTTPTASTSTPTHISSPMRRPPAEVTPTAKPTPPRSLDPQAPTAIPPVSAPPTTQKPKTRGSRKGWFVSAAVLAATISMAAVAATILGDRTDASPEAASSEVVVQPPAAGTAGAESTTDRTTSMESVEGDGNCPSQSLAVVLYTDKSTYTTNSQPIFTLVATNAGLAACRQDVGKAAQNVSVKTLDGSRTLWSAQDCSPVRSHNIQRLQPQQQFKDTITWSGFTSSPGCTRPRTTVGPGSYQAIGKVGENESEPITFNIVARRR
ncbi:serine/threonine protein kinase [Gordonia sp. NPDC003504]